MSDDSSFDGRARLFPLPNLVCFPQVVQPLHIFEPRYREMTADALAGDKRIALVLPKPGWEEDYDGRPAVHSIACLGKIVAEQKLADGRYNLLLRGTHRIRIVEELGTGTSFRVARVRMLEDQPLTHPGKEAVYRNQLVKLAPAHFPHAGPVREEFRKLLAGPLPIGALTDIVAFALGLDAAFKQELLEELNVGARALKLIERLGSKPETSDPDESSRKFPPEFSVN
jgi:Lon protease-like protein